MNLDSFVVVEDQRRFDEPASVVVAADNQFRSYSIVDHHYHYHYLEMEGKPVVVAVDIDNEQMDSGAADWMNRGWDCS